MKEKELWEKTMSKLDAAPSCARAEDLVTYLYGEADEAAAQAFEAHTQRCVSCRTELSAFKRVRASVGEWRVQALGSPASTVHTANSPVIAEPVRVAPARTRSALSALREFFSLSPVWMRAATAAVAVVFCALAVLTVSHYREQPEVVTVKQSAPVKSPEKESAMLVDEQAEQKAQTINNVQKAAPALNEVRTVEASKDNRATPKFKRVLRREIEGRRNPAGNRKPELQISPQESREIAGDLRLTIASNDEDDLPRLYDLVDESN